MQVLNGVGFVVPWSIWTSLSQVVELIKISYIEILYSACLTRSFLSSNSALKIGRYRLMVPVLPGMVDKVRETTLKYCHLLYVTVEYLE